MSQECSMEVNNIHLCSRENSVLSNVWQQTHNAPGKEASSLNCPLNCHKRTKSEVTPCAELQSIGNNVCVCVCVCVHACAHMHVRASSTSYSMNMWTLFPGNKAAGHVANQLSHSHMEIKNEYSYTCIPLYVFMACTLSKYTTCLPNLKNNML